MNAKRTIEGRPVTEAQIEAWAAEAERGFDIPVLKKRGRGRPGRAASASQVISLRFTDAEIAAIDARAQRENVTRSELIRAAVMSSS